MVELSAVEPSYSCPRAEIVASKRGPLVGTKGTLF